jgi:signal transduction histidine kinase
MKGLMRRRAGAQNPLFISGKRALFGVLLLLVLSVVSEIIFSSYISRSFDSQYWTYRKQELVRIVDVAYASCMPALERYLNKEISKDTANKQIADLVERMTYRDEGGMNYVFMCSRDGTLLAHPFDKGRVGQNLFDLKDKDGIYLMRELLAAAFYDKGGGFINYSYAYPDQSGEAYKLSYAMSLPGLDSFIATGLYIDRALSAQRKLLLVETAGSMGISIVIAFSALMAFIYMRRLLSRIRVNEYRFRAVFNGIDHFISLLDSRLNFIEVNPSTKRFLDRSVISLRVPVF